MDSMNEEEFNEKAKEYFTNHAPDFDNDLIIAVIGDVSSGKSSLINAILECDRSNKVAEVGATSGVTTSIEKYRMGDLLVYDSPGLDDIINDSSKKTVDFISQVDIAIFVVSGSANESQKNNYIDVQNKINHTLLVLNKIDQFDDLDPQALYEVEQQWIKSTDVKKLYKTCARGYDPITRKDLPLDTRGINELRDEVIKIAKEHKKELLFIRHLKGRRAKRTQAISIAATAIVAAASFAFVPGSTAYITGAQVTAIASLDYLYTGEKLNFNKASALALAIAGQNIGKTLFVFAASFIPGGDVVGSAVAVLITTAMMAAVIYVFESGKTFDDVKLSEIYNEMYKKIKEIDISKNNTKDKGFYANIIESILK
ncbi:50S ribosome-binding GTPase [Acidithiobacillus sp. MC6.1]|nr:50S ribosome-binding GTPase [Acidithiobacillus sp. MC6.1]